MKLLLLFYFSACLSVFAADPKVFYNLDGQITSESEATFYRVANQFPIDGRYQMTDFYMNGVVAASGAYLTPSFTIRDGEFKYFYPDGQLKSKGTYEKNLRTGEWQWWYPNGVLMKEALIVHTNSIPNKEIELTINFWDENGTQLVTRGKGELVEYNEYQYVGELSAIARGDILDGLKHGSWRGIDTKGNVLYKELYRNGFLLRGKAYTENGKVKYSTLSKAPMPVGGVASFKKHIVNSLRYPRDARYENITGQVLVQFVIGKDGSINDVETIRGIGGGCDEEAERVIEAYGDWEPGIQRGQLRQSRMIMPITFDIQ